MSTFTTEALQQTKKPDPTKHVKYTQGMVLGVDEFVQEFAYLSGRDQWMVRDLVGYGTVSGLSVSADTDPNNPKPRVLVTAGTAVSPRGQMIRVSQNQCAYLNDWLAMEEHRAEVMRRLGSPAAGSLPLYVVLSYRSCPTDEVPIPGEPCRSEEELAAASRLKDDFVLDLCFEPPDQCEEDAVRAFIDWLSSNLQIGSAPSMNIDDFKKTIHNAAYSATSPPCSTPGFMHLSPPGLLVVNTDDANKYLRAAFLIWVTKLRPLWKNDFIDTEQCADMATACAEKKGAEGVLLAELEVPLADGKVGGAINVIEDRRPYLLHLRMQQEWLACCGKRQE
jgi:hypothetical protein